jgi:N,N'-diacetyllegionaminate synthase
MKDEVHMKTVYIGEKAIGKGNPVYIIAEIGINHNGDVELARDTIDAALDAGADAVKLQTYTTEGFIHPENPIFGAVKSCELSRDEYADLFEHARRRNGVIFSTPECKEDIQFLMTLDPSAIKIASMDLNYKAFIQLAAGTGKPILLSTGMSYLYEVANTVRWIEEVGNDRIILFHCVSCYPTPPEECNLSSMGTLADAFGYPVGFSDHTIGQEIPSAAVCMGAQIVEKHFTLDKGLEGPDHAGSADPNDLSKLVSFIRTYEKATGHGIKRPSRSEEITRLKKRRSIYAERKLLKGETLSIEDIQLLTPSVPESQLEDMENFLGRKIKEDIPVNGVITSSVLI